MARPDVPQLHVPDMGVEPGGFTRTTRLEEVDGEPFYGVEGHRVIKANPSLVSRESLFSEWTCLVQPPHLLQLARQVGLGSGGRSTIGTERAGPTGEATLM